METPKSVSPASVPAPPMAQTTVQPASAMSSVRVPKSAIPPLDWTQLPGGAILVAASPDGSIWVLSSQGVGLDRAIWHYVNGTWTNVPGAAMRLSVAPNGTLWAVNSAGGLYAYSNGAWSTIAGGASDITVGSDGSVYVISNQGGGTYGRGIWRYSGGLWTQLPGAAVRIAANWDAGTYAPNIAPGGFYVINAGNSVFYYNPTSGFAQLPGGVVQLAPTKNGGVFALGYIANGDGSYPIYYNDLNTGTWTQQPGAAVSIATDSVHVYAIGAAGGIYAAPPTRTFACTDQTDSGTLINGYYPCDLTAAYSLPAGGANGSGAVIIVVDAYDDPNAESDMTVYRAKFGLGTCSTNNGCFRKINQRGVQGSYPGPSDPSKNNWGFETALDLDMVSAICPNCKIVLAEADSASSSDLAATVSAANAFAGGATAISSSYGAAEIADEVSLDVQYGLATVISQQTSDVDVVGSTGGVTMLIPGSGSIANVQLSMSSGSSSGVDGPQDITFGIICTTELARVHPCPNSSASIADSAVTVSAKAHYTWTFSSPVVMNPNYYYWIDEFRRTGGFYRLWGDFNATPTYNFNAGWGYAYYVVGASASKTAVIAAAGDNGYGVQYPAASPKVIAVGGTSLYRAGNSRGWTETVWNVNATHSTGSGCSAYEQKPAWQSDTGCAKRMVADVAAVADPGVAIYDTFGGASGWQQAVGTSVSTPIVAGIYGLVNRPTAHYAQSIYTHASNLNDITNGSNGTCSPAYFCTAIAGYDGPTGNGTPNGLVPFGSLGDAAILRSPQSIMPNGLQRRVTSGPTEPVCGPVKPGEARCFAWRRTDIGRMGRNPMATKSGQ
jgi:hypothetical protein